MNALFTIWAGDNNEKSPFLQQYIGGVELDVYNLSAAFARLGHAAHFLALAPSTLHQHINGVFVHHVRPALHSAWKPLNFYLQALCYKRSIHAVCKRQAIDIVNPHLLYPCATSTWLAVRTLPVALVPTIASRDFVSLAQNSHGTSKAYIPEHLPFLNYRLQIMRSVLQCAHTLITIAPHLGDDVNLLAPRHARLRLIPPGIDHTLFAPGTPDAGPIANTSPGAFNFAFTARFAPPKRHDLVLDAMSQLVPKYPNAHLHLLGDGPNMDNVQNRAAELGIRQHVHLHGRLHNGRVAALLSRMDAFIFACDSEGLPKSVLEALGCGLPVIASNIPPLPLLVQHGTNGFLVENNASAFAASMSALIDHPETLTLFRNSARLPSRYTFPAMVADYEEAFREAIVSTKAGQRNHTQGAQ